MTEGISPKTKDGVFFDFIKWSFFNYHFFLIFNLTTFLFLDNP